MYGILTLRPDQSSYQSIFGIIGYYFARFRRFRSPPQNSLSHIPIELLDQEIHYYFKTLSLQNIKISHSREIMIMRKEMNYPLELTALRGIINAIMKNSAEPLMECIAYIENRQSVEGEFEERLSVRGIGSWCFSTIK